MKNRYTAPFGYIIVKGVTELHPAEAPVVRQIFADYITGAGLRTVADGLAARKVEYLPGESTWNINRVKRILEDERYTGAGKLPPIIDEAAYASANAAKVQRNNHPERKDTQPPACPVLCAACGEKMQRRHDIRWAIPEIWVCKCGARVSISDNDLQDALAEILNRLIAHPDIITDQPTEEQEQSLNIVAAQNEISRQLEGFHFDRDQVKESIFQLAALKYSRLDERKNTTKQLRAELNQMAPLSAFSAEALCKVAGQIIISEPVVVQIKLKNGQIIGKEDDHEGDSDPGQAGVHAAGIVPAAEHSGLHQSQHG